MVNFCAVLGCSNRSDRDTNVSYHRLPINKPALLKQWIHNSGVGTVAATAVLAAALLQSIKNFIKN